MILTIFEAARSSAPGVSADFSWGDLKDLFSDPDETPSKDFRCYSPTIRYGNKRGNSDVEARTAVVLDFDGPDKNGVDPSVLDADLDRLRALGIRFLCHSTWSSPHLTTGRIKARVLIPLAGPVPAAEWEKHAPAIRAFFPSQDKTADSLEHVFYFPSVPDAAARAGYMSEYYDGIREAVLADFMSAVTVSIHTPTQNTVDTVSAPYPTEELSRDNMRDLAHKMSRRTKDEDKIYARMLRSLAKGESFAEPGGRHSAAISLIGLIVTWFPSASPSSIAALFAPVLSIWNAESVAAGDGPIEMTEAYVADQAGKFRDRDARERAERDAAKEKEEKQKLAFLAALDARRAETVGRKDLAVAAGAPSSGLYSPAEMAACKKICGARTDEELARRWIACFGGGGVSYLRPSGYSETHPYRVAGSTFERELARAGLDLSDDKGRPVNIEEAKKRHGFFAPSIFISFSATHTFWDDSRGVFVKALCPPADDLDVRYDAEWDRWLDLVGGKKADRLKDWLACADKTDRPCAVLYLDSTEGSGKGLLTKALCSLWKNGSPLPFDNFSKSFQYFDSPIVEINEGLKADASSVILRRVIGDPGMRISQKFEPDGKLEGCVRVIALANNGDVFSFDKEILGLSDQIATAKRIVRVEGERITVDGRETSAATRFLVEKTARDGLSMEARAKSLAGHIKWLTLNRTVKYGGRFLVEGDDQAVVDNIVTGGWTGNNLCELLVSYATAPEKTSPDLAALARISGGSLQVNSRFLSLFWADYHREDGARAPSCVAVGKTMRSLSDGQLPPERVKHPSGKSEVVQFWSVSTRILENWCSRTGQYTVEALREALSRDTKNAGKRIPPLEKISGERNSFDKNGNAG